MGTFLLEQNLRLFYGALLVRTNRGSEPAFLLHALCWQREQNHPFAIESIRIANVSHHELRLLRLACYCFRQCLFLVSV
jgi:hypothetical protein